MLRASVHVRSFYVKKFYVDVKRVRARERYKQKISNLEFNLINMEQQINAALNAVKILRASVSNVFEVKFS